MLMEFSEDAIRIERNMWKTTGAFINSWRIKEALESKFQEHAHEVWERYWMNPEMVHQFKSSRSTPDLHWIFSCLSFPESYSLFHD